MTRSAYTERNIPFTAAEIFGAFEDPAKLAKWWGPDGFASTFETFEFSENGPWKLIMHGPNGVDYPNEMVFREIDRNRRIVVEHIVSPLFTLTITLTPRGDGTFLTWNQEFENEEVLKRVMAIVGPANEQNLNRLTAVLNGELP